MTGDDVPFIFEGDATVIKNNDWNSIFICVEEMEREQDEEEEEEDGEEE